MADNNGFVMMAELKNRHKELVGPLIENSIGMEFVLVQPGTFQMGSDQGDADERPVHAVTISKPYYIGKYLVKQMQWQRVMANNPSNCKGENRPVENVSWNDAHEFIQRLNRKEDTNKYRLPTEAEWEFAARGGIQSRGYKFSGSDNVGHVAVYDHIYLEKTRPVGSKWPNELGIFDMSGNVWEWCQDWFGEYSTLSETDPKGPSMGEKRVLRGGSFGYDYVNNCRVAFRGYCHSDYRIDSFGFRCVRDVE